MKRLYNASLALGLLMLASGWTVYLSTREPARIVNVRWVSGVEEAARPALRQRYALRNCVPDDEGRTDTCDLVIWTPEHLEAIVVSPMVEDTAGFHRGTFEFPSNPRLSTSYTWTAYRSAVLRSPGVIESLFAAALLLTLIGIAPRPPVRRAVSRVVWSGARIAEIVIGSIRGRAEIIIGSVRGRLMRPFVLGWKAPAVVAAVCSVPLFQHAAAGTYSRFLADDYCSAATVSSTGVLGMTVAQYRGWSGRYTAHALDGLVTLLGPIRSGFVPGIALVLLVIGLTVYFARELVFGFDRLVRAAVSLALASLIVSTVFYITPDVLESLYWGQGMRAVLPALIVGIGLAVLVSPHGPGQRSSRAPWGPACAVLAFGACGVGETAAAVQTAALTLFVAHGWLRRRSRITLMRASDAARARRTWALAGSLVGSAVVVASPGNTIRQSFFPSVPEPLELFRISGNSGVDFLQHVFEMNTAAIAGAFVAGSLLGLMSTREGTSIRRSVLDVTWFLGSTALVLYASFVPAAYGMSTAPPSRTLVVQTFVVVVVTALCGHGLAQLVRGTRSLPPLLLRLAAVGVVIWIAVNLWTFTNEARERGTQVRQESVAWDRVDAMIRAERTASATVVTIPLKRDNWAGRDEVGPDPQFWVNACVSQYYGVQVVATAK